MPESTVPPPKKGGGSGALIVAAVVMAAAMVGLIVWKLSSSEEPPPETEKPVATQPAEPKPVFEAPPPPPPPPEEEPDAAPEEPEPKQRARPAGDSCAGPCNGKDSPELRSGLRARAGQARGCYERALRQNPNLEGKMTVALRIGPTGQVCSASVADDGLGDPSVTSCILQRFRASSFAAPTGGCVDAAVPMNFVPRR